MWLLLTLRETFAIMAGGLGARLYEADQKLARPMLCPDCPTTVLTTQGTNQHHVVIACRNCGFTFHRIPKFRP